MTEKLEFDIKRSPIDRAKRKLVLENDHVQFENRDLLNNSFTKFNKTEIASIRFGINWISYILTFGREYIIEIKNSEGKVLKINFSLYFGRNIQKAHDQYAQIVNGIWKLYFPEKIENYLSNFREAKDIEIGEVKIDKTGITIAIDNGISRKRTQIDWNDVETRNYRTYFSIYSKSNPSKINRGYSYKEDWNTIVLRDVIETILEEKKIK
jgi:hypothetical protein